MKIFYPNVSHPHNTTPNYTPPNQCPSEFNGEPYSDFNYILVGVIIALAIFSFVLNSGVIVIIWSDRKLQAHQPNIGKNEALFLAGVKVRYTIWF